jgi:DNA-directed RNA polymerase subunit RPC12/RpoP
MASCDYCGSRILFGGVKADQGRFCNDRCYTAGALIQVSQSIPEATIQQAVWEVHQGACPKCGGRGPVDVHTSYRVWSALLLTQWSSHPEVSCRSCGVKAQLGNTAFSAILGWWGFPWGLIFTPVQVFRNLYALASPPDTTQPSALLDKHVRLNIAAQMVQQSQSQAAQAQPIAP